MQESCIGYIDPLGNFILPRKDYHVDPYHEDNLGFFKKISYNDKLKEVNDSLKQAYYTLKDISDTE